MAALPPQAGLGGGAVSVSGDDRTWASVGHLSSLSALVGVPFGHVLGPLIIYLIKKGQNPWLDQHLKEALNYNISWTIYGTVAGMVGVLFFFATLGIGALLCVPVAAAFALMWLIFPIVAAVKASNVEGYRYPLTIRFIP